MPNYNPQYRKFIDDKNRISSQKMLRGRFYQIKEYDYVDGKNITYTENKSPIIYTLFVSKSQDIVHCVKVSDINPKLIKRFFGKFVNEETEKIEMKGNSKSLYQSIVSKIPMIKNEAYRTYKLSGIEKVLELNIDATEITPKNKQAKSIKK